MFLVTLPSLKVAMHFPPVVSYPFSRYCVPAAVQSTDWDLHISHILFCLSVSNKHKTIIIKKLFNVKSKYLRRTYHVPCNAINAF